MFVAPRRTSIVSVRRIQLVTRTGFILQAMAHQDRSPRTAPPKAAPRPSAIGQTESDLTVREQPLPTERKWIGFLSIAVPAAVIGAAAIALGNAKPPTIAGLNAFVVLPLCISMLLVLGIVLRSKRERRTERILGTIDVMVGIALLFAAAIVNGGRTGLEASGLFAGICGVVAMWRSVQVVSRTQCENGTRDNRPRSTDAADCAYAATVCAQAPQYSTKMAAAIERMVPKTSSAIRTRQCDG
jgi:hypothetical protein